MSARLARLVPVGVVSPGIAAIPKRPTSPSVRHFAGITVVAVMMLSSFATQARTQVVESGTSQQILSQASAVYEDKCGTLHVDSPQWAECYNVVLLLDTLRTAFGTELAKCGEYEKTNKRWWQVIARREDKLISSVVDGVPFPPSITERLEELNGVCTDLADKSIIFTAQ